MKDGGRCAPSRTAALGSAMVLLAACGSMQMGAPAPGSPAPGSPGAFGGDLVDPIVVEYVVECRGCRVEYATPIGMRTDGSTDEVFRRRVHFDSRRTPVVTRLRVTPPEDRYVEVVEIWVDGRVVGQGGRGWGSVERGQVVQLTATVRR